MTPLLLAALLAAPAAAEPAARAVPRVPLHRLISNEDYPAAALAAGQEGEVRVALDIAPEGRVTGCTILSSSRSAVLDSSTCRLLVRRARFVPARNAAGRPVADRFETTITWIMNASPPPPNALDTAIRAWLGCLKPALEAGLADKARPARAIAEAAFPACRVSEDQALAAISAAVPQPRPDEDQRTALREHVIELLAAHRNARQP